VHTTAKVHIDRGEAGFKITRIELQTEARVAGIPEETSRLMPGGRRHQGNIASIQRFFGSSGFGVSGSTFKIRLPPAYL
jgi:hypothetical protein